MDVEGAGSRASPLLSVSGITKRFGGITVLDEVTFDIPSAKVIGLVGENGAGKSTLLNVLSGMLAPDAGEMHLGGEKYRPDGYGSATRLGISRIFQDQALILNVPVYANLVLGQEARFLRAGLFLDWKAMAAVAQKMVEVADIDVDVCRLTWEYDFSRRQAIEIVRACLAPIYLLHVTRPIVLMDEPTSALDKKDEAALFRLINRIKSFGSVVFVSHRLTEVLAISDVIHVLKDGRLVATVDPHVANESTLHSLMVGRERVSDYYHESRQCDARENPVLLEVRGLSRREKYKGVSLKVKSGEIVGIGGLLASGKSDLGKGIMGLEAPDDGSVRLEGLRQAKPEIRRLIHAGVGYIPAERLIEGLIAQFRLSWNISMAGGDDLFASRFGRWFEGKEEEVASEYVKKLSIRGGKPNIICQQLSGGNQQKVVLARWLCRKPRVLVLDNPTQGVDAGAKEEIYQLLRDLTAAGAGILLITDELLELIGLSNRIMIMQSGEVVAELDAPPDAKPTEKNLVALMLPASGKLPPTPPNAEMLAPST
ncbi:MAG: sugar ABC transporter ATP-binding protein [Verrucomicrobia bacterium]|nr:sugar ABC transporter ATP-binding protein [Verrucomicrobiota bacterium]